MSVEPSTQCLCYNCFQARETQEGPCPYCGFDLEENAKKYPVALQAGTVLNDRYIIGRVLGQGGFGITYLALDTQLNAKVAIKEFMPGEIATRVGGTTVSVLAENRSEEFTYGAERFQEEARTLAKFIGNPNIAGVSSYFDENDTSYFVMDYIEGISFKTYIANHGGKISVEETLNIMIPVLRALTAVHAEGFIHRDVTPDNIYITKDGIVKLLDFGSARYSIGDKSKSLDVILKVGYAPKEQYIRRSRQGPFTDVYSCAACFYAAITGFLPPESLERLDHDELVPISQCGIEIPEYLDKAILKGLAVQPEDRFQSAEEFLNAIESRQVVEVPVSSGGAAASGPEKKTARPALIAGIAAAVVVAVGIGMALGGGNAASPGGGGGGNDRPLLEAEVPSITIAGQEYSTDLQKLDLQDMGLTDADIQDLKYMINLYDLRLSGNDITDLTPLAGLTQLENLTLRDNQISDLSPLASLTELRELQLGGENAGVKDLSPLAGLTKLEYLSLSAKMEIEDPSPLGNLTNLKDLSVDGSQSGYSGCFTDISFLGNMPQLKSARLSVSGLESLEGIQGAAGLTALTLQGYNLNLTDLSALAGLTQLQELQISGSGGNNYLSTPNLSFLSGMKDLRTVWISYNSGGIDSLEGVQGATALTELYLEGVEPTADLSAVSGLTNLQALYLYGSGNNLPYTENLDFLSGLHDLRTLHLSPDGLTDFSGLANCTQLRELYLPVPMDSQDLQVLSGMTELQTLQFEAEGNVDLSPLAGLENLQEVTITNSDAITNWAPLDHARVVNRY